MASASQALVLRFGADTSALRSAVAQLAADAPRNLALISQAAIGSSRALREGLISAAADGARGAGGQLLTLARDTDNLRLVAGLAGEGMKTAFALHHPILAIGLRLLSEYKTQLALVAAGVVTVHEALKIMGGQFDRINHIIDGALKSGVSATLFQAWTDQAARFGLTAREAEQALDRIGAAARNEIGAEQIGRLVRAADELQNGLHIATRAYGLLREAASADDVHQAALLLVRDYLDAAEAMRASGQEAKGARLEIEAGRIASEAWGESAYKIVDAIKSGRADIEGFVKTAREAGYIWGEDIVNAQKESNEMLRIAREHLANELAPTMRGLAEDTVWLQNIWTKIVQTIADAVAWTNRLALAVGLASKADPFSEEAYRNQPQLRNLAAENAGRGATVDAETAARLATTPLPPARPSLRSLEAPSISEPRDHASHAGSADSTREAIDQVERYLLSLEKENAALRGEAEALGRSNVEREQSIDIAKAEQAAKERGTALTEEERAKVLQLAEAHATLKHKVDETKKAEEQAQQRRQAFASIGESAVEKLVVDNQKLVDVLKDVVRELERAALKQALLGGDGKSGVLGTIVNAISGVVTRAVSGGPIPTMAQGGYGPDMPASMLGGLAEGTDNWRGGWSWVGENGPELLNLPRGSQVVPNAESVDYVRSMARMVGAGRALSAPPVLVQGPRLDLSGLAALGAGRAAPATTVNIHKAPAETRAEETTDSEGGRHVNINLMAGELLERGLATQRGRAAMAMYGVRPGIVKR